MYSIKLICNNCKKFKEFEKVEQYDELQCPDCHKIIGNKSICKSCNNTFWLNYAGSNYDSDNDYKYELDPEYDDIKSQCYTCRTNKKDDSKFKLCKDCENYDGDLICYHCNNNYGCNPGIIDDGKKYSCKCYKIINNIKEKKFHKDKEVNISYNKISLLHDGYCSDPEDTICEVTEKTKIYPLTTDFDDNDIDIINGEINIKNKKLEIYDIKDKYCKLGSGWCGYFTSYKIKKAIVKNLE